MTEQERKKPSSPPDVPERRRRPRPAATPADWEAIALSRVARKVESLASNVNAKAPPELGWEARALANLRRRLKNPDAT